MFNRCGRGVHDMAQRHGSQYRAEVDANNLPAYSEPGYGPQNPRAGDTGDPYGGTVYSSYGTPNPYGRNINNRLLAHLGRAGALVTTQYAGFPQWNYVGYGILTPMAHLRTTGPEPAQQSDVNNGPVSNMSTYFGGQ